MRLSIVLFALFSISCAGSQQPYVRRARTHHVDPHREHTELEVEISTNPLRAMNSALLASGVTETMFGVEVADPYRALEEDNEQTRHWIELQNQYTEQFLASAMQPAVQSRLETFLRIGAITKPTIGGERVFFLKREAEMNQPALFVSESGSEPRKIVDPNELPRGRFGEKLSIDWFFPSPHGNFVAVGISQNGDERSTLHVYDVNLNVFTREAIEHTKWARVSWLAAENGFYYSRYPRDGEPNYNRREEDTYYRRLFFHQMGTNDRDDQLVFDIQAPTHMPAPTVSADDRYLVVNYFRGWTATDVFLIDRRANVAPGARPVARPVVQGRDCISNGSVHQGALYITTNCGAPRWKVVKTVDFGRPEDTSKWRTVIPEGQASMEDVAFSRDRIIVHRIENVASRIALFDLEGHAQGTVQVPDHSSADIDASPVSSTLALLASSYLVPPQIERVDLSTNQRTTIARIDPGVDLSGYQLTQVDVRSADGTQINVYLVHRADAPHDGSNRVLLTGYGGFNISLLPNFTRHALYWLENGGVFAVANLRGGGEFGEAWHRAGSLENKRRVFEDFEAVTRWLTASWWSVPQRIAITGGSNGGLLMGAMLTRAPQTFAVALSYVGLYDMIRYTHFPPAELWTSEYGDPAEANAFRNLLSYSPYHNVREGTRYPAVLIETGDHDTRVSWAHSTKFAARLQQAVEGDSPICFYREQGVGHGAGTSVADQAKRYARMYAFLARTLDVQPAAPAAESAATPAAAATEPAAPLAAPTQPATTP